MYTVRRASKFGNTRKEYNGRTYMSKLEAKYAQDFDLMLKAGELKEVIPQYRLSLDVNGYHIGNYIVDFKLTTKDDEEQLVEIKGFETDVWRMKWKLAEALYGDKYKMIIYKQ